MFVKVFFLEMRKYFKCPFLHSLISPCTWHIVWKCQCRLFGGKCSMCSYQINLIDLPIQELAAENMIPRIIILTRFPKGNRNRDLVHGKRAFRPLDHDVLPHISWTILWAIGKPRFPVKIGNENKYCSIYK